MLWREQRDSQSQTADDAEASGLLDGSAVAVMPVLETLHPPEEAGSVRPLSSGVLISRPGAGTESWHSDAEEDPAHFERAATSPHCRIYNVYMPFEPLERNAPPSLQRRREGLEELDADDFEIRSEYEHVKYAIYHKRFDINIMQAPVPERLRLKFDIYTA